MADNDRKNEGLIPKEDLEYEKELLEKEQLEQKMLYQRELERAARVKADRERDERELRQQKVELVKLKQGVIESSETIKEEPKEEIKLSPGKRLAEFWYRSKWIVIFCVFTALVFGYIVYDTATRTDYDLTVLVVMDNQSLYARTPELTAFLEEYCDDINGDGEVNVLVYNISTNYSDPTTVTSSQAQLMTQLQLGENMLIISDGTTDFEVHDFTGELEGECVTALGIRLNCSLTRDKLKWQQMPDELYIGIREPARLLSTSYEEMSQNYENALPTYLRIYEAIASSEK